MMNTIAYSEFTGSELSERIDFLDDFILEEVYHSYQASEVKLFLQSVFTSESNIYLRQQALLIWGELVLLKFLRYQSLLGLLIEDIDENADSFIQITRLRLLFLHCDASTEVLEVFDTLSNHIEAEVASEALFRKGLLLFLSIPQQQLNDLIDSLRECSKYFLNSAVISENRLDAKYYEALCQLIIALIGREVSETDNLLNKALNYLFSLRLFSSNNNDFLVELKISWLLSTVVEISHKLENEGDWIDYSKELNEIFLLHQDLINIDIDNDLIPKKQYYKIRDNLSSTIIPSLYKSNLLAISSKIKFLLTQEPEGTEYEEFLKDIHQSLIQLHLKKKEPSKLIAQLSRRFTEIPIYQIETDINCLDFENASELAALLISYTELEKLGNVTGFPQGDEVLSHVCKEINELIPNYSKIKLVIFSNVLADTIRYLIRTMQEKKEFFPELYDSRYAKGRTEHIFQESLYKSYRHSPLATHYLYEPNQAGGGRIDITYNDQGLTFPIEVKKTATLPTWDSIKTDYLAQAQTYTNSYDQLGLFIVFDLSDKSTITSPINNFRELVKLQSLNALYNLNGNYPSAVLCVIIPANKVSPSSMSTYR